MRRQILLCLSLSLSPPSSLFSPFVQRKVEVKLGPFPEIWERERERSFNFLPPTFFLYGVNFFFSSSLPVFLTRESSSPPAAAAAPAAPDDPDSWKDCDRAAGFAAPAGSSGPPRADADPESRERPPLAAAAPTDEPPGWPPPSPASPGPTPRDPARRPDSRLL